MLNFILHGHNTSSFCDLQHRRLCSGQRHMLQQNPLIHIQLRGPKEEFCCLYRHGTHPKTNSQKKCCMSGSHLLLLAHGRGHKDTHLGLQQECAFCLQRNLARCQLEGKPAGQQKPQCQQLVEPLHSLRRSHALYENGDSLIISRIRH